MRNLYLEKIVRTNKVTIFLANLFRAYPVRQFAIIFFSILVAQLVAWFLFEIFLEVRILDSYHGVAEITILTISLSLISFPILFCFSYRPLHRTIKNLQAAQSQLVNLNQELLETNKREHQSRQLTEALLSANQALSQSLDLDFIVNTFLDFLFDFVPFDIASILMPTTQSRWIVLKAIRCQSGVKIEIDSAQSLNAECLLFLKSVIDENRSLVISDTRSYEAWQQWPNYIEMRSWLGLPFISDGTVIGICELYKESPNYFTAEYLKLAETLIHVATTALQNAMLFDQVQAGRKSLQLLSHRLVEVQEEERRHIARELHDEAGQGLASLMFGLRLLEGNVTHPEGILAAIDELKGTLSEVSERLHGLAVGLRPASLDHLGIVPILTQHVEEFAEKYDIDAQFETIDIHGRLPIEMETAVYRIVQEGLTNIARHGQATCADILLQNRGDKLLVIIEDNGIGFDLDTVNKAEHLGLVGIAERAEMLNGMMTIESAPGAGTTILVEVPYETTRTNS
jgi:signal transduction histidine kinase